jgi:hypothetical protein
MPEIHTHNCDTTAVLENPKQLHHKSFGELPGLLSFSIATFRNHLLNHHIM